MTSSPNPSEGRDFRSLTVWQSAMELVVQIYQVSAKFPRVEQYGLTSQLRRAAVSVPANIAEGNGRMHRKEYIRFLSIARGSLREASALAIVAERLGYLGSETRRQLDSRAATTGRMLNRMIASLRRLDLK